MRKSNAGRRPLDGKNPSKRVGVILPNGLLEKINEIVARDQSTISQVIRKLTEKGLIHLTEKDSQACQNATR